jgi:hypothetical protein
MLCYSNIRCLLYLNSAGLVSCKASCFAPAIAAAVVTGQRRRDPDRPKLSFTAQRAELRWAIAATAFAARRQTPRRKWLWVERNHCPDTLSFCGGIITAGISARRNCCRGERCERYPASADKSFRRHHCWSPIRLCQPDQIVAPCLPSVHRKRDQKSTIEHDVTGVTISGWPRTARLLSGAGILRR